MKLYFTTFMSEKILNIETILFDTFWMKGTLYTLVVCQLLVGSSKTMDYYISL